MKVHGDVKSAEITAGRQPHKSGRAWVRLTLNAEPEEPVTVETLQEENAKLKQQVSALADQQSFYEDCIAEMAQVVYA